MTHLALFLPLQVLLQALFLQKTVLFMPVLYIIFGMPINTRRRPPETVWTRM
jgi:hypothetical protein